MTQHHQNNWRPRPRNNNYKAPKVNKWQDERQKEDDQIAPDGVSGSTYHLERWALMTADMPQQPTKRVKSRAIEEEIRERIQRRYQGPKHHRSATSQDDPEPMDHRMVVDLTGDDAQSQAPIPTTTMKRPHSPSPSPARNTSRTDLSTVSYVQTIKRRRSRSPSPRRSAYSAFSTQTYDTRARSTAESDEDYNYAQSSEWSFPSSDDKDDEMT